jgi:hypothetical protein
MKKLSKTQKQITETIGIDLGDKVSRYCVLNQEGEVVEEGTFRNQGSSIEKHFAGEPFRIALEAGARSAANSNAWAMSDRRQPAPVEVDHRQRYQK